MYYIILFNYLNIYFVLNIYFTNNFFSIFFSIIWVENKFTPNNSKFPIRFDDSVRLIRFQFHNWLILISISIVQSMVHILSTFFLFVAHTTSRVLCCEIRSFLTLIFILKLLSGSLFSTSCPINTVLLQA